MLIIYSNTLHNYLILLNLIFARFELNEAKG